MSATVFERLGNRIPVFAFSHCRDVVAAVSKAGGVGVYGAALHSDEQIKIDLDWIEKQLDGKPYGVDLLMPENYVGWADGGLDASAAKTLVPEEHKAFLDDMMLRYDVPAYEGWENASDEHFAGQRYTAKQAQGIIDAALSHKPRFLVSALGTPPKHVIEAAHERGMLVGALAGKVKHAMRHKAAGVDIVIAQSYEAGGHTGDLGGMVLIPQVVDAVAPVPVLAAGGIADGRQIAAAMALGAQGVWCGSVWLTTRESECSPILREKLLRATSDDTEKSRAYTGKPARFLKSAWAEEWARADTPEILPNPLHIIATGPYRQRIEKKAISGTVGPTQGAAQLLSKPVGQVVGMLNEETSCRGVITQMMTQLADALVDLNERIERQVS